jgi:probable rRNA maturation factor
MRVDLSWAEGIARASCPMPPAEIRKLFRFLSRELAQSSLRREALEFFGVRSVGAVSLYFCDDQEMRQFQRRYRKLDRTTDILSFPTLEVPGAAELMPRLESVERSWGDLVVSLETVERGARRARRTPRDELAEVLVHGFLHLLGMDHVTANGVTAKQAREMKALQRKLFQAWKTA